MKPLAIARRLFSSCFYFPFVFSRVKNEKGFLYVCFCFPQENCSNNFIHYQAVFPPFVFRTTQTHDCVAPECNGEKRPMTSKNGYKKTGTAGSCHNCKVRAFSLEQGLPEPQGNCHRSSLLAHPLYQSAGRTERNIFTNDLYNG